MLFIEAILKALELISPNIGTVSDFSKMRRNEAIDSVLLKLTGVLLCSFEVVSRDEVVFFRRFANDFLLIITIRIIHAIICRRSLVVLLVLARAAGRARGRSMDVVG